MARKAKTPFTFENNAEKIKAKIQEKPHKVMSIVGANLTKEMRATTIKQQFKQRAGILSKTLGYWARKKEGDLQIGFKMSIGYKNVKPGIIGKMYTGEEADPMKPVVMKNRFIIRDMIAVALDEIRKE